MIVYVVPSLQEFGGIQEFAKSIYSELHEDYDIHLLDWKETGPFSLAYGALTRFPPRLGHFFHSQLMAPKYREKNGGLMSADLIHFWYIKSAVSFLEKKYVVSCHGREILPQQIRGFEREAYSKILANALCIHANSHFTKKLIVNNTTGLDTRKVKKISPCLPFKSVPDPPTMVKKRNELVIGTLSRFNKRKNIMNIIESLNILKEKYDLNFKYYLAGDGLERNRILSKLKKVSFEWRYFGIISERCKVREFYPAIDIFVMPPLDSPDDVEGFGIVYLEANAYGIPVVASKVGGVPDAVNENISGVFADPRDPQDIAMKILNLAGNREKYAKTAKQWAAKFDKRVIAKEFAELYDELL